MSNHKQEEEPEAITSITICGFKSLVNEITIDIRPLTILAGANSSGKSSAIQPLLLLKQTLEATYDAGPLRIDGPNVRFTSYDRFLSKLSGKGRSEDFTIGFGINHSYTINGNSLPT